MTARIEKTVFISYRRANLPWALAIYQNLKSEGYDVFFDYLSIPSGDFENIIVENIKGRTHFVVILTPSALERCNEPEDWLRREIETAMDEKRNIVPLMLESFDFGSPSTIKALTGRLEKLKKYNGLRLHSEYFFEGMDRLRKQYLNISLDTIIHPISEEARPITEEHQVAADEVNPIEKTELTAQEWYERGYVFQDEKNYDEALRCLTNAINLNGDFARAYFLRGSVKGIQGDYEGALSDVNNAVRIEPQFLEAYGVRAVARENTGDLDGAITDYTKVTRDKTLDKDLAADTFHRRGLVRLDKGDLIKANKDFDKAIQLKPDSAEYFFSRGVAHIINNNFDNAMADVETAIHLDPNYIDAYFNRALIWEKKKAYSSAIADYQKYLKLGGNRQKDEQKKVGQKIKTLKGKLTKKKSLKKK
ncbi:MAG: tetratricopeptide repeat protein [Chloroflexota bacterium]